MGINRRNFLKGSTAFAVSASVVGCSNDDNDPIKLAEKPIVEPTTITPPVKEKVDKTVFHTTCPRNCGDRCSLMVTVENDVATSITGLDTHPITAGTPCVKGHAYLQSVYSPDRIKTPMKRVGPKGPGAKFEPITWDEANKAIAAGLKEAIAKSKNGGNGVLQYSYSGYNGVGAGIGANRFFNKIGSRLLERNICASAGYAGMSSVLGTFDGPSPEDYANTKCFVSWGTNEQATNIHQLKIINKARDNGAKILVVNPARTPLASQADVWLRPRPGTDATLVIGIAKCIIEQGLEDKDFIKQNTQDYDAYLARLAEFTHEQIEKATDVKKTDYQEFAQLYANAECSIMRIGYGMQRNLNGGRMVRAIPTLAAITGNIGKKGAGVVYLNTQAGGLMDWGYIGAGNLTPKDAVRDTVSMNELGKNLLPIDYVHPDGKTKGPLSKGKPSEPINAVIIYQSNPMVIAPNTELVRKGLERDDIFLVGIDLFQTDTMDYVDYLLPTSSFIEQENIADSYHGYFCNHSSKAIEYLHDSKPDIEIFQGLGRAMGFSDPEFSESINDIMKKAWKGNISYDELVKKHYDQPKVEYPFLSSLKFNTPSGKIEFKDVSNKHFDSTLFNPVIDTGTPETDDVDHKGMTDAEKGRAFRLLSPAHPKKNNSQWANVKYIEGTYPSHSVYINPADSSKLGVQDGDKVEMTATRYNNEKVSIQYDVIISEMSAPGSVFVWKNAWRKLNENGSSTAVNMLTNNELSDMNSNSTFMSTRVDIKAL
ncbi:molybdopterin-dependent oxidoreductase [Shewanella intestini]|uniref:Molybdopterin-dependent oxidoreductase n=1 Tax=Shewanella intestini TaxID=2017544 RepID=A0ABS5I8C8_9GAMM|nr:MULTISPECIES: molybdopterin-dependent oxidoreductase [Shewanella]MBR9729545.1 molybdopterin-dependent oxidoreductase [Shewanella intestini]MRG37514.1 molybdopterin-dependent oxidoreductase [Shewanella sp. XMDDZSB0408]